MIDEVVDTGKGGLDLLLTNLMMPFIGFITFCFLAAGVVSLFQTSISDIENAKANGKSIQCKDTVLKNEKYYIKNEKVYKKVKFLPDWSYKAKDCKVL